MTILVAFILGGLISPMTIGGLAGYYWARADIRRLAFSWFHKHWPEDYHSVCEQVFEDNISSTELH